MVECYYQDHVGIWHEKLIGFDGEPIERTPDEYPYSYDAYFKWKSPKFRHDNHVVYSDRMFQWDHKKFESSVSGAWPSKVHGQMFGNDDPKDVDKFLKLYFGDTVELTGILQGCNVSSGYPYWIFTYIDKNDTEGENA